MSDEALPKMEDETDWATEAAGLSFPLNLDAEQHGQQKLGALLKEVYMCHVNIVKGNKYQAVHVPIIICTLCLLNTFSTHKMYM